MRTYKYRGRTFDGKWVYGDLETKRGGGFMVIHTYNEDGSYSGQRIVNPKSVGQYVCHTASHFDGVHHGCDIYEGDIVRVLDYAGDMAGGNYNTGAVRWNRKRLAYVVHFSDGEEVLFGEEYNDFYSIQVIGNEFDNPSWVLDGISRQ